MSNPVILKSGEHESPNTKSDPAYDADITKALHKDGDWYLIPRQSCFQYLDVELHSLVFHICPKSWLVKSNPDKAGIEQTTAIPYTIHRLTLSSIKIPCPRCKSPIPDSIVALFTLHNWDSLQGWDSTPSPHP